MTNWRNGLLLLVLSVGFGAWYQGARSVQPETARWVRIEPQTLEQRLGLVGRLQAACQVTVNAPFEGRVAAVLAQPGQQVGAGDPLFTLDTEQLDIELRMAQAAWLKARRYADALEHWTTGPEVARAKRNLSSTRNALSTSQLDLEENRRLFERGIVAGMEVRSLIQLVDMHAQAVLEAEQALEQTLAQGQGDALQIARMELLNAEAQYHALLALHGQRTVNAPLSGVVVPAKTAGVNQVVPLQAGQHVARGVPVLELIGLDRLQVLATVEEQDLPNVQQGQPVRVTVAGQHLEGRLGPIAQQPRTLDGAGAWYEVVAELELPAEPARSSLRLGMSAQVDIRISSKAQALVIPPEALQRSSAGEHVVWFREDPGQAPSEVTVSVDGIGPQGVEVSGLGAGYVRLP
ncbi:efflux RND transporter periplasmic adaptor subunit [Pseudomonas aeruginosa]